MVKVKQIPDKAVPLDRRRKEILKSHCGSATSKIDMNKVREWVKYGDQSETDSFNQSYSQ